MGSAIQFRHPHGAKRAKRGGGMPHARWEETTILGAQKAHSVICRIERISLSPILHKC